MIFAGGGAIAAANAAAGESAEAAQLTQHEPNLTEAVKLGLPVHAMSLNYEVKDNEVLCKFWVHRMRKVQVMVGIFSRIEEREEVAGGWDYMPLAAGIKQELPTGAELLSVVLDRYNGKVRVLYIKGIDDEA